MELTERLDQAIGPAPVAPDRTAELLAAGHRAVRRRRLASGVLGAAVVAAGLTAGGYVWADSTSSYHVDYLEHPAVTIAPATPTTTRPTAAQRTHAGDLLQWRAGGWHLPPSAQVVNVVPDSSTTRVALVFRWHGWTWWQVSELHPDGSVTGAITWARDQTGSFGQWLDLVGPR
jgi:hypothetical protein